MSSVYVTSAIPKSEGLVFISDFKEDYWSLKDSEKYESDKKQGLCPGRRPDKCLFVHLGHIGVITVVDRTTGYIGSPRDTETGFRKSPYRGHNYPDFWLASGDFDIRKFIPEEGINPNILVEKIKRAANTVIGE